MANKYRINIIKNFNLLFKSFLCIICIGRIALKFGNLHVKEYIIIIMKKVALKITMIMKATTSYMHNYILCFLHHRKSNFTNFFKISRFTI